MSENKLCSCQQASQAIGFREGYDTCKKAFGELLDALEEIGPFELIQGDSIHRLQPGSRQVLNSSESWAVGKQGRSAHRLREAIKKVNEIMKE